MIQMIAVWNEISPLQRLRQGNMVSTNFVLCAKQEFEGMLEESKDIKLGFRYGQARTLFEDDPRWKVRSLFCTAKPSC